MFRAAAVMLSSKLPSNSALPPRPTFARRRTFPRLELGCYCLYYGKLPDLDEILVTYMLRAASQACTAYVLGVYLELLFAGRRMM